MPKYESYEDWYDNGPGSEAFNRDLAKSELEYHKAREVVFINGHLAFIHKGKEQINNKPKEKI